MDRYQTMFTRLHEKKQGAFVPFVVVGDPNPQTSFQIMETLITSGADALELGIPFVDPLADGVVIQEAHIRALNSGATLDRCFDQISQIREKYPMTPIGLLMYANLIYCYGIDEFYKQCFNVGIDSVLIADVPIHESAVFVQAAKNNQIHSIFIAPPDVSDELIKVIAELGSGYTYLLSRSGVTGADVKANISIDQMLKRLNAGNAPPALLGFGVSEPKQVQQIVASGAGGAISGSAVVKIIESNLHSSSRLLKSLNQFISSMKLATQKQ